MIFVLSFSSFIILIESANTVFKESVQALFEAIFGFFGKAPSQFVGWLASCAANPRLHHRGSPLLHVPIPLLLQVRHPSQQEQQLGFHPEHLLLVRFLQSAHNVQPVQPFHQRWVDSVQFSWFIRQLASKPSSNCLAFQSPTTCRWLSWLYCCSLFEIRWPK